MGFLLLDAMAPAGRRLAKIRGEDPVNYFGITHSLIFDRDVDLTNQFLRIPPDQRFWTPVQTTGLPGSPWGIGYSLLEIPLLAVGTALDWVAGNPADGYSHFAILVYCLGSPLFTGLGLIALFAALRNAPDYAGEKETDPLLALGIVFAIFLGTNVGYYGFSQTSHASTFMMASVFMAQWLRARRGDEVRAWVLTGLAGGFLSICRWQDLLYLGGPLFYELAHWRQVPKGAAWWRSRLAGCGAILLCWIPQIVQWKVIYDKYLTVPQGSGFLRFPPEWMAPALFSSRNGWFTWTPLVVLCCVGLLWGLVKMPRRFVPWVVVLVLEIMVVGAMETWHGYDSFGARYLLSMAPIIALGLWHLLGRTRGWARATVAAATAVCCLYSGMFAIQFRFDLVPKDETLTMGEMVWDKFRLGSVRRRKAAVAAGRDALARGDAAGAIAALEPARAWGEDRQVEVQLAEAYRAVGNLSAAAAAEARHRAILQSILP